MKLTIPMTAPHTSTIAEECVYLLRSMHNQNWNGPINGLLLENVSNLLQVSFRKSVGCKNLSKNFVVYFLILDIIYI